MSRLGRISNINTLISSTRCGVCIPNRLSERNVSALRKSEECEDCGLTALAVAARQCAELPSSSNSHVEALKRQLGTSRLTVDATTRTASSPNSPTFPPSS